MQNSINDCNDVAVIVCTKNVEKTIEKTIRSIMKNEPGECIIVDAHSTDGTREILNKYDVRVLEDPGQGLALARQIGIEATEKKFVFFCGDDNILKPDSLLNLKRYMLEHEWIGAAMLTRVHSTKANYWAYGSNFRWKTRFYEGERFVIGTPYMFYTEVLKEVSYDKEMAFADDSDIEKRILEKHPTYKMGYSNVICYEIGKVDYDEMKSRFKMYGVSDYQFWKKHSKNWTFKRKVKSIMHPFKDELLLPLKREKRVKVKLKILPYLIIITFIRYHSWAKCGIKAKS